ncbi:alpha-aminoadipic semialdehyde synthase-like isoform X1 [Phragmites australis]|uniref:alpha-aminoadipic semialdehyde synthase-like isoform X1 n=2 Tax=Phragmites australis TaxID=29695 RepID=UPI002D790C22|nr:alpha-aminoadipic semialdehyde synthase-like isoform X1 [Phragmites australis]
MGSAVTESNDTLLGNGVVGILAETVNMWERRAPLTPSHCARLLLGGGKSGTRVNRIIVQPSTKRIHHDAQYEDAGCKISDDLSECGLIIGIKQPKLQMILPDRAYAFFSHTHKAQQENMPLLDKILEERVSLFDYELIVGDNGKRLLAFGKFAGRAGLIDFLHGLGQRYLSLGFTTPFLSLGRSHMYPSLAAAKAAVIAVGEEIATFGLPSGICPIVFVFTGVGNVSQGAQEIFKLLPHAFVDAEKLPEISAARKLSKQSQSTKRVFQLYGCVVTSRDMVSHKDPNRHFDKADYYAHPEHYIPVFHERIAPYASVIVNCMYWERRFPRLLSINQLQQLMKNGCPLVGVSDITCDIGGSIEFVNKSTSIERPFFRYDASTHSYHDDMEGDGVVCLAVDILPTEFSKEASQHFGDMLSKFVASLASAKRLVELPSYLRIACIAHAGRLTSLYEYIPRMRKTLVDLAPIRANPLPHKNYSSLVSLSGHLFDKFLINEALDIIETSGGSFRLVRCDVGQSIDDMSYSELEIGADDTATLDKIIDSLTSLANAHDGDHYAREETELSLKIGKVNECGTGNSMDKGGPKVLILGAGRVCRPAAEFLASYPNIYSNGANDNNTDQLHVIVASLYQKDSDETVDGIKNATATQLDVTDTGSLSDLVSQVEVVISLLPTSFHAVIARVCIELKKHLVTASYVDESMSKLGQAAEGAGVTILCEMGLDPGIDHMVSMKMIDEAHARKGKIKAFTSFCGGLPSPAAANNPLAYKFSWNPAGALRAGSNPAVYKFLGQVVHVDGNKLYNSAKRLRLPELPAFALEHLPNRNSLIYGDLYGISKEASTVYRATLRYEGFSDIMATLSKTGFFYAANHPLLQEINHPTYMGFLDELLNVNDISTTTTNVNAEVSGGHDDELVSRLLILGHCKDKETAVKTVKTIKFLGLHEETQIPKDCSSAFDVICQRMEQRMAYHDDEQDMVLLHHELEVEYSDGRPTEKHQATLLEFGKVENGRSNTAMALTVGIPAAIGALLLLQNKVQRKGVIRPLEPEIYIPALEILESSGIKLTERVET